MIYIIGLYYINSYTCDYITCIMALGARTAAQEAGKTIFVVYIIYIVCSVVMYSQFVICRVDIIHDIYSIYNIKDII